MKASSIREIKPGDAILFKAGQTFKGSLRVQGVGTPQQSIVVGSYGTGPEPILSGFTHLGGWVPEGGGVWGAKCSDCGAKVRVVSVDGAFQPMGRFPKTSAPDGGFLRIGSFQPSSLTDTTFNHTVNWVGGDLVTKSRRWVINRDPITWQSGSTFGVGQNFYVQNNFGYFIQNHESTLRQSGVTVGDWYYHPASKTVKMYFGAASPNAYNVNASSTDVVIDLSNLRYVKVVGIAIEGAGTKGINVANSSSLALQDSAIRLSGTDGVCGMQADDLLIDGLKISNSGSAGINVTMSARVQIRNNTVSDSGTVLGAGENGDASYSGINIADNRNSVVSGNFVTNSGYNGIAFTGSGILVERNFIKGSTIHKDDGGGIYTFQFKEDSHVSASTIRDNIVLNSYGAPNGTDERSYIPAHGIYLDGRLDTLTITGNTVAFGNQSGLFMNGASNVVVSGNTFYDNGAQLYMASYADIRERLRNANIFDNVMVSKAATSPTSFISEQKGTQPALLLRSETNDEVYTFGQFSNNFYVSPLGDAALVDSYLTQNGVWGSRGWNLPAWQAAYGKDTGTKTAPVRYAAGTDLTNRIRFEYNASASPRQVALDANYVDAKGLARSGTLTLQPYTSIVLFR